MQVAKVTIRESVVEKILGHISKQDLSQSIGQAFTRYLSVNQSVSVLPYTIGHAIGNKLAGRYANGEVYMMELPETDFSIDIELIGLKKKKYSENAAGIAWIYATQAKFRFYEPLTNETIFDEKLFNAATKKVPSSQLTVNDWHSYNETLIALFDKFTIAMSDPDKKWLKSHSGNTDGYSEMKELKKVVFQCRHDQR